MSEFKLPPNFPTPRVKSVIIKKIVQGTSVTASGIELLDSATNVQRPNVGIIYAVGPDVAKDLVCGQKVYYNQYADLTILVQGHDYVMMSDTEVFCILADENRVSNIIKPADEVRRRTKIEQQAGAHKRISAKAANDKDQRFETYKKTAKKK
jgi:co-chaperonin GroES (HSP10)